MYIRDVNDKTIATLDRGDYFNDTLTRFLAGKASVLEFTILKKEGDYELFSAGKKISFKYEDEEFWLNMMITDQNEKELTVTALSLNMEFNNETVGPFSGKEWTFKQYFDNMLNMDYSLTLGINEVSDKKISNEWTGTSTLLARLFSLATVFSAELEFVTELNPNGSLKRIVLNVYKEHSDNVQGLGADRRNETFRFGKDIKTVRKSEDASGVYTAIRPYGKDGLTIASIEAEVKDEDGRLLYATYKTARPGFQDPAKIYAPQSRDLFPSTISGTTDKWIAKETDEMDYSSAEALYGYALGELKKNSVPQVKWEISGYIDARIGDTIRVADNGYKPEIYLDARITEQSISFTDPSKNKSTFSNVEELQSQISDDLLKVVEDLKKEINYVLSTTVDYQVSDQGKTVPTGDWVDDLPTTQPGEWLWTRTTQSMSNGTSVVGYTKARNGTDGEKGDNGPVGPSGKDGAENVPYTFVQTATPSTPKPKKGDIWWVGADLKSATALRFYDGSKWVDQTIAQTLLNIIKLTAIEIDSATINSSKFNSPFDIPIVAGDEENRVKGSLVIDKGNLTISYQIYKKSTGAIGTRGDTSLSSDGQLASSERDSSGNVIKNSSFSPYGIYMTDKSYASYGQVSLGFQDLITVQPTMLTAATNWAVYSSSGDANTPLAARQGRVVQLSGAFRNTATVAENTESTMGTLPVWARPAKTINFLANGSGVTIFLCTVKSTGEITMSRYRNGGSAAYASAGSWFNIACTYAAGDIPT